MSTPTQIYTYTPTGPVRQNLPPCVEFRLPFSQFIRICEYLHTLMYLCIHMHTHSHIHINQQDPDISIRRRALDLVYLLVNSTNVRALVKELLNCECFVFLCVSTLQSILNVHLFINFSNVRGLIQALPPFFLKYV